MLSTVFGFRFSMHDIANTFNLSEEAFDELRDKVEESANACMRDVVQHVFHCIFLEIYHQDFKSLKADLSRQMLLKGAAELSNAERQHLLRCLWQCFLDNDESDLIHSIFKDLIDICGKVLEARSRPVEISKELEELLDNGIFIPSVW